MYSYHVSPNSDKWVLRRTGANRATKLYDTCVEAWAEAKRRSAGGVAYLHDETGRIIKRYPKAHHNTQQEQ